MNDSSYFQKVTFTNQGWTKTELSKDSLHFEFFNDFFAYPSTNNSQTIQTNEILFLGYGIDDPKYSDYSHVNVKDKVILIYSGEPLNMDSISWITGSKSPSDWTTNKKKKLATAYAKGVKAVFCMDDHFKESSAQYSRKYTARTMGDSEQEKVDFPPNAYISPELTKIFFGKAAKKIDKVQKTLNKGKSAHLTIPCHLVLELKKYFDQLISANVLGFIEGTDPLLKNELVIVSAHFDHLGKSSQGIFHGADDNGSGTSGVLTIAHALTEAKKQGAGPRRSVLCLWMTGEEKGLLGSKYYVNFPIFPLEKTVADVNIDMIGRVDDEHKDNPNYIYVIGSNRLSTELHDIDSTANATYTKLLLDYKYNAPNDPNRFYYRSDHYNFAERGIPAIFYFNGTHEDYHRTTDTIDKINFEKMAKIAQLAFYTVWELANRNERIKVNVK